MNQKFISSDSLNTYALSDKYHSGLTVQGLFSLWLSSMDGKVSRSSFENYRRIVSRHIIPFIGQCEVDYLTEADINDFLKEKLVSGRLDGKGGLSYKTVEDISFVMRSALKLVEWDYSLVMSEHEFVRSQHDKRDIRMLTMEQAETLTRYLTRHLNRRNAGFLLCLYTGIRLSEICSLKDSDLILKDDIIQVRRTLQRVTLPEPNAKETATPTVVYGPADSYYRDLLLPPRLSMLLWFVLRRSEGDVWFLTGSPRSSIGPRAYRNHFQRVLEQCGLPQTINFHMLRHTFALFWLLRDGDMEGLSRALGHSSVGATMNRYSKVLKQANEMLPRCAKYLCRGAADAT